MSGKTNPTKVRQAPKNFNAEVLSEAIPCLQVAQRHLFDFGGVKLVVGPSVAQRADRHAGTCPRSSVLKQHVEPKRLASATSYTVYRCLHYGVVIRRELALVEVSHSDITVENFVRQA